MLTTTIGKLMYRGSFSLITVGICASVEKYVEIERNEAVHPAMKAGTRLLKKTSETETRMRHAMIYARVEWTERKTMIKKTATSVPIADKITV